MDTNQPLLITTMTRQELARLYKHSDRQFRRKLERAGLSFPDRVLLPHQVRQIVEQLGPWEIYYSEP